MRILILMTFLNIVAIGLLIYVENRDRIKEWDLIRWKKKCNRRKITI